MIIMTHPDNKKFLNQINDQFRGMASGVLGEFDLPVRFSELMEPRDITYRWEPPTGDKFTEYGPEDESWMRPLKLGTLHPVDNGPLFINIDESAVNTNVWGGEFQIEKRDVISDMFRVHVNLGAAIKGIHRHIFGSC